MDQIIDQLLAALPSSTLGQLVAFYVLSSLLSLLLARKSQVDAWAESRPRLAAVLKLLRSMGLDWWLLVQALSLAAHRRLPVPPAVVVEKPKPKIASVPPIPPLSIFLLLLALVLTACFGSSDRPAVTARDAYQGALTACAVYRLAPSEAHEPAVDVMCAELVDVCSEATAPDAGPGEDDERQIPAESDGGA